MPSKDFMLSSGLIVTVYKRRTSRNLRLSIAPSGKVRVSIPTWVPYQAGLSFAKARQSWIDEQHKPPVVLVHGQAVGKSHHLAFVPDSTLSQVSSRVSGTSVVIRHPAHTLPASPPIQAKAEVACVRALRHQAEHLLPQRLAHLAASHGFTYNAVSIKRLKSRWGSCDQRRNIVLNLYLMQLPWELIDYVLLHELTHTKVLRHGPDFWQAMLGVSAESKSLKKRLRDYQPVMGSIS